MNNNNNNNNNNNIDVYNNKHKCNINIIFNDNNNSNNNIIVSNICSYLWFNDIAKTTTINKTFYNICNNNNFNSSMFNRLLYHMGREIINDNHTTTTTTSTTTSNDNNKIFINNNSNNTTINWKMLSKRITLWPTSIDNVIVRNLEPRNVCICNSDNNSNNNNNNNNNNDDNLCVLYKRHENGDTHKPSSFAVVVADQYFPCLPRAHSIAIIKSVLKNIDNIIPSSNSSHNSISSHNSNSNSFNEFSNYRPNNSSMNTVIKSDSIYRSSAPFSKIYKDNDNDIIILSCIAYFEVKIHEDSTITSTNNSNNNNNDNGTNKNHFSIGLACPLFPLRRKYPGFDNYSFGYHCDGKYYHGGKNCIQKDGPSYSQGDVVGCGIIYPPLSRNYGRVFFTKNGEIASILDINNIGLLSVPWFPIIGLQESVKMEFNFGLNKPFMFNVHGFEHQQITRLFEGASWGYYDTIAKEAELTDNTYRHPKWLDAYASMNNNRNNNNNNNNNNNKNDNNNNHKNKRNDNEGDNTLLSNLQADSKRQYSLFLDTNLRASILLDMNRAKKVAFGGSDASWEGTAEEDDEEDYSDYYYNDDDVNTNHNTSRNAILEPIIARRSDHLDDWPFKRQRIGKLDSDASGDEFTTSSGIPIITLQSELLELGKRDDNCDKEDETEMGCNNSMAVEWSSDDSGGEKIAFKDELHANSGPIVLQEPLSLSAAYIMALSDTSRAAGFLQRSGLGLGLGFDSDADSERSIATSLFVEVASVDECGSYQGYGGASETEKEDEETGYHDDDNTSYYNSGSNNNTAHTNSNNNPEREYSRNHRYTWDRDGDVDGYDGASERGRCETDVGEEIGEDDLGTDADVGEEIGEDWVENNKKLSISTIPLPRSLKGSNDDSTGSSIRKKRHKRHRRSML